MQAEEGELEPVEPPAGSGARDAAIVASTADERREAVLKVVSAVP